MTTYSVNNYTVANGKATYNLSFSGESPGYLDQSHVKYYIGSVMQPDSARTFPTTTTVTINPVPVDGTVVSFRRETSPSTPLVDWLAGASITEGNLDRNTLQMLYVAQETADASDVDAATDAQAAAELAAQEASDSAAEAIAASSEGGTLVRSNNFDGDGTEKDFTLGFTPLNDVAIIVKFSGVGQNPNTYSVDGNVLSFSIAPPDGVNIEVRNMGYQRGFIPEITSVTFDTIADLRSYGSASTAKDATVLGYYTPGDGGGGPLRIYKDGEAAGTYVDNGGSIIVPTGGDGSEAWLWVEIAITHPEWFGAKGDSLIDDIVPLQAAVDNTYGSILLLSRNYMVSDTLVVANQITIMGTGGKYEGIFSNARKISGAYIKLITGSFNTESKPVVSVIYAGEESDSRVHVVLSNFLIDGNRSDLLEHTDTTNNTYGVGIQIEGGRYTTLDNMHVVFCAENGAHGLTGGTQSAGTNNFRAIGGSYLCNKLNGMSISGGDSFVCNIQAGFNGVDGIQATSSLEVTGVRCWDNKQYGLRITGPDVSVNGGQFYDNYYSGIILSGTLTRIAVSGVLCRDNGKDTGIADSIRSGIYVSGITTATTISCISTGNKDETGATGQKYGLRVQNSSSEIVYSTITGADNGIALISDLSLPSIPQPVNSSGETPLTYVSAISGTSDDLHINRNFSSILDVVNKLTIRLQHHGLLE